MPNSKPVIGLTSSEAKARALQSGTNVLPHADSRNWIAVLLSLLSEPMLLLLIAASLLYVAIGDPKNAAILGASVLLVIALTLYQELRAEGALAALRDLSSPRAKVWRDNELLVLPASELVLGDCVEVSEGDRIPADLCVLESAELQVDESLLTGESNAVNKSADADASDAKNRLFSGSLAVRGRARAEVLAIGANTEMGKIGNSLRSVKTERTPLQKELRRLVAIFFAASVVCCTLVVTLHYANRGDWTAALLAGITLAMATIPEEFPVVLTMFLALGAWRMSAHRVLVRRAPAIEALGSINVLCTDKTGTLTENRMSVTALAPGIQASRKTDCAMAIDSAASTDAILACAALACPIQSHDAMDIAIRCALLTRDSANMQAPKSPQEIVREYPLSAALTAYTVVWRGSTNSIDTRLHIACKGAPETLISLCNLDAAQSQAVLSEVAAMASRGLRVLATAEAYLDADQLKGNPLSDSYADALPDSARGFKFSWVGLLGFSDPLRARVPAAVQRAQRAGVRVLMLTGDHLQTATVIAAQAGISDKSGAMLGADLLALNADAASRAIAHCDVYARVRPEHKLRIVETLKAKGEVVAMTGDGVNDAPALRAAHVGIAMGARGTDVARESASIVLLDDDFASIVRAIELGRSIYENVRRASGYIIAVHMPIAAVALLPLLLNAPSVLLPLHVVFLELVIDPACAVVLEREPAAADTMLRPPRSSQSHLVDRALLVRAFARGLAATAAVFLVYFSAQNAAMQASQQAGMTFVALVMASLWLVNCYRVRRLSIFPRYRSPQKNQAQDNASEVRYLTSSAFTWMFALIALFLVAIAFVPIFASWFGFTALSLNAFVFAIVVPITMISVTAYLGDRLTAQRAALL